MLTAANVQIEKRRQGRDEMRTEIEVRRQEPEEERLYWFGSEKQDPSGKGRDRKGHSRIFNGISSRTKVVSVIRKLFSAS